MAHGIITADGRWRRWPDEGKLLVLVEAAHPGVRLSEVTPPRRPSSADLPLAPAVVR